MGRRARRRRLRLARLPRGRRLSSGSVLALALSALAAALILLLLPLVLDDHSPSVELPPEVASGDATPQAFDSPIVYPRPQDLTRARVIRVIDGDTIDADVNGERERIRYYGVDAPERTQLCYEEATAWNRAMADDEVLLLPDERERDRFGRLLRYVFTPEGDSIDAALVAAGVAIAWRDDGVYRDQMVELEQAVRDEEIGCLWEDSG